MGKGREKDHSNARSRPQGEPAQTGDEMKILWLHQYFATPKGWGSVRTYEFARRFVKAGHAVDLVCCAGYDASLKPARCAPVLIDGVRVFVSGTHYRPQMGFVRRIWSFLLFMNYALFYVIVRGGRYDVMIASSGPLTMAVPALVGRWFRGTPFVFEVMDVWPDSAIAAGVLRNSILKRLCFAVEALAYKYASAIVTCSTGMTERVEKKLVGSEPQAAHSKVATLSNCCDLEPFAVNAELRKRTRARLGVGAGQMVVLYTGAMGLSNAVDDLVKAVKKTADDERIVWWFAGGGQEECKLQALLNADSGKGGESGEGSFRGAAGPHGEAGCRSAGVSEGCVPDSGFRTYRSRWFRCLPKHQIVELYLAADVNVVTFMHAPLFYENSPNKFFDGIAAGLPTVFNRTTWLEPWLEKYGCGIVCKNGDAGAEMAQQLKLLASNPERRLLMGEGARRLAAEVFNRDKLASEYLSILSEIGQSK